MKIRMHRGGLKESLETMMEVNGIDMILHYLLMHNIDPNTVKVKLYDDNMHEAIGWNKTYIIMGKYKNVKDDTIYPLGFSNEFFEVPKVNHKKFES